MEETVEGPDGGWGWAVVFGGFLAHFLIDGTIYSMGVFYQQFLVQFQQSKSVTSWVASLLLGVYYISSPISSALTVRYGYRPVAVSGSILSAFGLLLSAIFGDDIYMLFITLGIITGLGFSLTLLPAVIAVSNYFNKRRSLAMGITVCGSGAGTFCLAPIFDALMNYYGWKGALISTAGIVLNCAVAGVLMKPLQRRQTYRLFNEAPSNLSAETKVNILPRSISLTTIREHVPTRPKSPRSESRFGGEVTVNHPCPLQQPPTLKLVSASQFPSEKHSQANALTKDGIEGPRNELSQTVRPIVAIPKDLFWERSKSGSYAQSIRHEEGCETQIRVLDSHQNLARIFGGYRMMAALSEMMNLKMLKEPPFFIFSLCRFFFGLGLSTPMLFIKDRAMLELHLDTHKSTSLLSAIGFSSVVGRIGIGFVSDYLDHNRLWLYTALLIACGCSIVISTWANTFTTILMFALVFGFTSGGFIMISNIVLVDLVGLEKLTNAYGLSLVTVGIAAVIGPPLNGYLYDSTGSYSLGFVVAGTSIILAGVVLFAMPKALKMQEKCLKERVISPLPTSVAKTNLSMDISEMETPVNQTRTVGTTQSQRFETIIISTQKTFLATKITVDNTTNNSPSSRLYAADRDEIPKFCSSERDHMEENGNGSADVLIQDEQSMQIAYATNPNDNFRLDTPQQKL